MKHRRRSVPTSVAVCPQCGSALFTEAGDDDGIYLACQARPTVHPQSRTVHAVLAWISRGAEGSQWLPDALDFRTLLGKYMALVGEAEGVDFIDMTDPTPPNWLPGIEFSQEEWDALKAVAAEGRNTFVLNPDLPVEDRGDGLLVVKLGEKKP